MLSVMLSTTIFYFESIVARLALEIGKIVGWEGMRGDRNGVFRMGRYDAWRAVRVREFGGRKNSYGVSGSLGVSATV